MMGLGGNWFLMHAFRDEWDKTAEVKGVLIFIILSISKDLFSFAWLWIWTQDENKYMRCWAD